MIKKNSRPKKRNNELRRLGVVMENVEGKISLVAEQYGSIDKKLDSHTGMIVDMKEDMEIMKQNIEFIKAGFKRKVDAEEFETLERRVSLLEKRR